MVTKGRLLDRLKVLVAGRVAQEVYFTKEGASTYGVRNMQVGSVCVCAFACGCPQAGPAHRGTL